MLTALLVIALAALLFFAFFGASVPAYTGVILTFFGKPWKSLGPGLFFRIPGAMSVERTVFLEKKMISIEADFEDQDEEVIPLKISVEYQPAAQHLIAFCNFDKNQIEKAIKERIKQILSVEIRTHQNRDSVMDNINDISKNAKSVFENTLAEDGVNKLEEYYGINLTAVVIADPELPEELKKAAIEREAMEKTNLTRDLEMKKIKQIASKLVKEAKKQGQSLKFETALEIVMINLGRIKKENRQFGLSKDTLDTIANLLPNLLKEFLNAGKTS